MKKWILSIVIVFGLISALPAQEQDAKQLHENAKDFIRQGDYNNAVVILNRLLEQDGNNLDALKDLAFAYYLKKDYAKALETAKPITGRQDADVQSYQILGLIYKALEEKKDTEKMYKAALKKFPNSGALYNEYGETLWDKKDFAEATQSWEKGIRADPNYSGNYYNAAKYYYFTPDKVWGLLYGEIFINLESYSQRTTEIKNILLDGYKKLFSDADLTKGQDNRNEFVKAYLSLMQKHAAAINNGVTPESIANLRTLFITDWYKQYASRFPFRLFEHQNQLVNMKLFDAYNQWIFTAAKDTVAYQSWTESHSDQNSEFIRLQKNRVFKIPAGQYYQTQSR